MLNLLFIRKRGIDLSMKLIGKRTQLIDLPVAFGPNRNRSLHVAHMLESPEQHRHVADVLNVVAALHETSRHESHIRRVALKLQAGLLVAERHCDFG